VARSAGALVGVWPLARRRRGVFRVLEPIGAGRSDWLDVPVVPAHRNDVLAAFAGYLLRHRRSWDLVDHRDVLIDSPSLSAFAAVAGSGVSLRRDTRTIAPYLPLTGTWESFLGTKRPKFRSNLKYYRRLPARSGQQLTLRRLPWGAEDVTIDPLAEIERRSWKARDGNVKLATTTGREFYRRFCEYFASRGQLDLWIAEIDSVPVAFVLNIAYGGKIYHYNTCYDEKFGHISPGVLLHADAIADAYSRGLAEYDFLSGDEPYKARWCSERRSIDHVVLFHRGVASRAAEALLVEARWALRRSEVLIKARQRVLATARRLLRGAEPAAAQQSAEA
jgi:CelD/BcsL family acetyltransferase involved in cellulose biosynthesis